MSEIAGQLSMDDHPEHRVRRSDPVTSRRAAFDNAPRAGTHKARILNMLCKANPSLYGITPHELSDAVFEGYVFPNAVARRLKDLEDDDLVERTSETRATPSGSQAIVWRITDKGREIVGLAGGTDPRKEAVRGSSAGPTTTP